MKNRNKIKEEVIEIKGMHCKSCAEKIEKRLLQLKGINKAKVSLVEEKAYVSFDPTKINLDTIKKEIESLGYKVSTSIGTTENSINQRISININSIKQGIIYGLIPHTVCIAFIIASVLGTTVAVQFFKPLLLNPYFFYLLIAISIIFATISAIIYLKSQGFITFNKTKDGIIEISFAKGIIRRKWKYLTTLYGTTIGVNLLFFMVIFPLLTNISTAASTDYQNANSISSIKLKVDIPCPGHAPLISQEIKSINGVLEVKFSLPNIFEVKYDPTKVTKQQILSLEVFKTYRATVLDESDNQQLKLSSNSNSNQLNFADTKTCGCNLRR